MPAGDAGLERQPGAMETLVLEEQRHWRAIKVVERERDELRAQLAAQQAGVDAAREIEAVDHGVCYPDLAHALAALDSAQVAQPEGES